ncbi:MAG: hypothetical protein GY822_31970, partial [Deltaproteobacteria bacterium]|nr:hypothetical protein [Deltaproteobacteria bacterium]
PTIVLDGDVTQFTEDDPNANDLVATFTTADEDGDTVTVTLSDTSNYALVWNTVVLTQVGADIVNGGVDLPSFSLVASDGELTTSLAVNPAATMDVNDAATIMVTPVDSAVTEDDAGNTASGTVSVEDDDTGQSMLASSTATYGNVTVDDDGNWTYTLDNTNATVNALVAGDTLADTITFTSADGSTQTQA